MKRFVIFFAVLILSFSVFAYQNTYAENSYEYRTFKALQRISGTALPQPTLPVSANQLRSLMEHMDTSKFNAEQSEIFTNLKIRLANPNMTFRYGNVGAGIDTKFSFEAFARTADYQFEEGYKFYYDDDLVYKYKDNLPAFELNADVFIDDYFAGAFYYDNSVLMENSNLTDGKFWYTFFTKRIDSSAPHKAYVSLGAKNINLIIGRDRVSAGNGRTGNLGFGDNFQYEDFAKLSVMGYPFSYDFTAIAFATELTDTSYPDSPYYTNTKLWNKDVKDFNFNDPLEIAVQHRFSVSLSKKVTVSLYESMLAYADNVLGDIRLMNPFMVLHGYTSFRDGNCNNWFGVEVSYSLPKEYELNFQMMFDQIQRPIEYDENSPDRGTDSMSPNALGAIINVSKATNVKDALLDTYVEMALVSHGMYHKELDSGNKHNFPGNVTDLIVGYDDYMQYLGYGLGSNLFAFGAGASYDAEKVRAELNAIYTVRGNTRKDSSLTIGKEYYWKIFPVIDKTLPGDALEHRIIIGSSIDADIYDFMTIKATAGFIHASNFRNVKSEQFNDFQVSLGVSLHLLPIAEDCISLIKK